LKTPPVILQDQNWRNLASIFDTSHLSVAFVSERSNMSEI